MDNYPYLIKPPKRTLSACRDPLWFSRRRHASGKHRDQLKILYDDDSEDEGTWSHYSHVLDAPIDDAIDIISEVALATAILPHDQPEEVPPRNFYECLVRDHWRDWVMAIKREMAGWVEFRAYENCFVKNLRGEKIIKTGELYSIKRDGRYKNRFIVFGNLMRKMVDYFYTTSYTLSYDGFRLFAALSSVFGKTIKGSDARCGYLQSAPLMKDPVYIYRPSFAPYFELPIDKIEELRLKLLKVLAAQGSKAIEAIACVLEATICCLWHSWSWTFVREQSGKSHGTNLRNEAIDCRSRIVVPEGIAY